MDTTLPALINDFILTKETEGKSKKTTEWYRFMLSKFAVFVGEEATVRDFPLTKVRTFIAEAKPHRTLRRSRVPYRAPTTFQQRQEWRECSGVSFAPP